MIYEANIFVCLSAPLLIAVFLLRGEARRFTGFFILGLAACFLSGYINGYLTVAAAQNGAVSMTAAQSLIRLTPICEETLKAMPVLLFAALYKPKQRDIITVSVGVGLGFATLENICYILQYGAEELFFILIRGFAAGIMHTICAVILGYGLAVALKHRRFTFTGSFAALCAATTFHAIYNLLVSADGFWQVLGYLLPIAAALAILFLMRRRGKGADAKLE